MFKNFFLKWGTFLFCLSFCLTAQGAEDGQEDQGVKHHGVVFNIAKDRRVEKVGGIYEPEGLDKYVDRRLSEVSVRLEKMEAQLQTTNEKIDQLSKLIAELSKAAPAEKDSSPK